MKITTPFLHFFFITFIIRTGKNAHSLCNLLFKVLICSLDSVMLFLTNFRSYLCQANKASFVCLLWRRNRLTSYPWGFVLLISLFSINKCRGDIFVIGQPAITTESWFLRLNGCASGTVALTVFQGHFIKDLFSDVNIIKQTYLHKWMLHEVSYFRACYDWLPTLGLVANR